ncbi:DMT family transporter [Acinetobacter sp. MD2(2019)]|uniref:DMT family transporter n=1 Tax=Acinetobacter sp. MD2(2019) TaxID=2605273 RepID=UPI002D1F7E94|nr:DMT family transporter [Acinetobacter sp. MD2(2019)]MEB3753777.1 DMT family transporter [Acinetobacter sp. MD2(2019)]
MNAFGLAKLNKISYFPQITLILITIIWGGTFLVVQHAVTVSTPMFFVGFRFATAALAVGLISISALVKMTWKDLVAGSVIGIAIAAGYGAQTVGLQTISSSESAFLTALYVPMVPLLQFILFRKMLKPMAWLGVLCAFIGLILLTGNGWHRISFNFGQLVTLFGAIAIALEILLISFFSNTVNVKCVTVIQLAVASLVAFISMPAVGENSIPPMSWTLIFSAVGLGLASALIQLTMNWAQRSVEPAQAAIIYAGEPVWAGLFGRLAGERLGIAALLGGLFVVLGVVVSELKWKPKQQVLNSDKT